MTIYRQGDPRWAGLPIGNSPYKMGPYGCLTTAHAIALSLAGWDVTPGEICVHSELYLNGLWYWGKIHDLYPQLTYRADGQGRYRFLQVWAIFNGIKHEHWLLQVDGVYYDPLDGTTGLKSNYLLTNYSHTADIQDAPQPPVNITVEAEIIPHDPQPFTVTVTVPILNVRTAPNLLAAIRQDKRLHKGDSVECIEAVMGDSINGNNVWLRTKVSNLFISTTGTDYHQPTSYV